MKKAGLLTILLCILTLSLCSCNDANADEALPTATSSISENEFESSNTNLTSTYEDETLAIETTSSSSSFMWGDTEINEFPYVISYYPKGMSIEVDGKDILKGETVEGVSFKNNVLILDNAKICPDDKNTSGIVFSGMDNITIELIGDNVVDSMCAYSISVGNSSLEIQGDGTLTTRVIGGTTSYDSASTITVSGNVHLKEAEYIADAYTPALKFGHIRLLENSSIEFKDIDCNSMSLSDNSHAAAMYCDILEHLTLSGSSLMEVETDSDDYPKYESVYGTGRAFDGILQISINDSSKLYIKNYCNETIFCYPNNAIIEVSDDGILEVNGNPYHIGISLQESAFGTLVLNDNAVVIVENSLIGIIAQAIIINGGTLTCNASEEGSALMIDNIVSPYASFKPGFFINGKIVSQSCDNWEFSSLDDCPYLVLQSDGNMIERFSITVE